MSKYGSKYRFCKGMLCSFIELLTRFWNSEIVWRVSAVATTLTELRFGHSVLGWNNKIFLAHTLIASDLKQQDKHRSWTMKTRSKKWICADWSVGFALPLLSTDSGDRSDVGPNLIIQIDGECVESGRIFLYILLCCFFIRFSLGLVRIRNFDKNELGNAVIDEFFRPPETKQTKILPLLDDSKSSREGPVSIFQRSSPLFVERSGSRITWISLLFRLVRSKGQLCPPPPPTKVPVDVCLSFFSKPFHIWKIGFGFSPGV